MKHIPNILTGIRIALIGVFCWLFLTAKEPHQYIWPLLVYALAFFTDLLDGYLARRNNWVSNFGKLFDPLADKLMLVAVLICFYIIGKIDLYILILVAAKELVMIIGGGIFLLKKFVVCADWWGKIATGAFVASVLITFVNLIWEDVLGFLYPWDYIISIVLSFVSMFHYGITNIIAAKRKKKAEPEKLS